MRVALPLTKALKEYDAETFITNRRHVLFNKILVQTDHNRYVPPTFKDIRIILNYAVV